MVLVNLGLWKEVALSLPALLNSFVPVGGYVSLTHHIASYLPATVGLEAA